MLLFRIALLALHIAAAAMIFGAPMGTASSLRRALLSSDPVALRAAAVDATRRGLIGLIGGIVTLLTGLGLIFLLGGFGIVHPTIHAALGLMFVALGVSFGFVRPTGAKLLALANASQPDKEAFAAAIKKLAMGTGIVHLLWLVMLVLMLVNRSGI